MTRAPWNVDLLDRKRSIALLAGAVGTAVATPAALAYRWSFWSATPPAVAFFAVVAAWLCLFLYRRSKGLEAKFFTVRVVPGDAWETQSNVDWLLLAFGIALPIYICTGPWR